jgi:hypothetical protein
MHSVYSELVIFIVNAFSVFRADGRNTCLELPFNGVKLAVNSLEVHDICTFLAFLYENIVYLDFTIKDM